MGTLSVLSQSGVIHARSSSSSSPSTSYSWAFAGNGRLARFRQSCTNRKNCLHACATNLRVVANAEDSVQALELGVDVKKRVYPLPTTAGESIDQARLACQQALKDDIKQMQLELLLPLIGATDLDDWPGGIQQQYKAAAPLVSSLLKGLVQADASREDGGYRKYVLDMGDAVGVWENDKIALVLFPTAESLSSVEGLQGNGDRPLLLVNVQWQPGQVISDFGFGSQRKAREKFVESFKMVYFLKQFRIQGANVRLLKRYPGDWQVFVEDLAGVNKCLAIETQQPPYKRLQEILSSRKGSTVSRGWFSRLLQELEFNKKTLEK